MQLQGKEEQTDFSIRKAAWKEPSDKRFWLILDLKELFKTI